ncbi:hypothetical protein [Salisediminibacterium selenitireducens]|uniref:Uncharacterized protein n=1 Tax=Bacillus selenitireducens (strain ATCC 700615 / DSM 15326 / MLS10) TaxID=439292 RepID=D6XYJ1_BACIE|nr:hypothetical protein [Salisediminibacterium selenitireducens]ADI00260.1 hypothetical protein Bsel_2767 [[Bacillus] selenitireducens MLS10]
MPRLNKYALFPRIPDFSRGECQDSFRVIYQEDGLAENLTSVRMDLDVMPLRVYRGVLEAGESVDTKLILAMDEGELQSLIAHDEGSPEVQWKID